MRRELVISKPGTKADCSVCRNAETRNAALACTKSLPMDAKACDSFRDARRPSTTFDPWGPGLNQQVER